MRKLFVTLVCAATLVASAGPVYTLRQIVDLAQSHNIAVNAARHDVDAAHQQSQEAFTKYFPNVSANGLWFTTNKGLAEINLNPTEMISPEVGMALAQSLPPELLAALTTPVNVSMMKHGTIASVMAVQPVFAGGQIVNGNRLARVGEDVSRLQLRLKENEAELTAEQYFWQLASLEEKMKTITAVESLLNGLAKDVDAAVRAGVAMRNDLLQVQLRQNEVASQKLKLTNGIKLVRMLLAQYCGLDSDEFDITYDTTAVAPGTLRQNHDVAVMNTAEYQLLGKQVEAAKLQERLALGQNLPTVAVGAGYNYHNLLNNNHFSGMLFATVSVPITAWWGGSHAMSRRKIETQKALEQQADNTELLKIRMTNAWNGVEEAYSQLQLAQLSIEQATENLRLNQDYYRAGISKMSDLLEAQMLFQQARDKHTDAFAAYQNKLLEYRQASGQ
ncbi:MAG: TolC family protein [Muribaculaceae bacterium]|nr:TolC family protein [Muribaculaceae bacterium]